MNQPIPNIDLPNPPQGSVANYHSISSAVKSLLDWSRDLTTKIKQDILNPVQTQLNSQVQGFGAALDSTAETLTLTNPNHHVTGKGTVTQINPPPNFSGPIFLVSDDGFSLGTGGNIASAQGPLKAGQMITLTYDPTTQLWYPHS